MKSSLNVVGAFAALCLLGCNVCAAADPVTQLLSEAQTAYLRGDLTSAKAKFESVNKLDPKNKTAIAYLRTIKAREAEARPGSAQQKQLEGLIVPKVEMKDATLTAVLDYLRQTASKLSEEKLTVNFVAQLPEDRANALVTLNVSNMPFTELLKYVGELANVTFTYDRYAITVRPAATTAQATKTE